MASARRLLPPGGVCCADLRFIQELLGHTTLETTQVYTQVAVSGPRRMHTAPHPAEAGGGDGWDGGVTRKSACAAQGIVQPGRVGEPSASRRRAGLASPGPTPGSRRTLTSRCDGGVSLLTPVGGPGRGRTGGAFGDGTHRGAAAGTGGGCIFLCFWEYPPGCGGWGPSGFWAGRGWHGDCVDGSGRSDLAGRGVRDVTIRRLAFVGTTVLALGAIPALAPLLFAGAGGGVAWAQDNGADGVEEVGEGDEDDDGDGDGGQGLGISGSLTLDNSVGIGSFYRADSTEIVPALTFIVSWEIPGTEAMALTARQDLTLYGLGALSAYTDQDPGEDVRAADTLITWSTGEIVKDEWLTGIGLSSSLRFYLPTSPGSQSRTLIMGIGPGVGLKRTFGFVELTASTRAKYSFHRFDNQVFTVDGEGDDDSADGVRAAYQGCVPRGNSKNSALRNDEVGCGGAQNADWTWYHSFASEFQITRALSASITLMIINSFGIPIAIDEHSSAVTARTDNENQRDSTWGIVDATYAVNNHLDLSVGISSLQTAKSADGEHIRFPWWDFEGPQGNNTSLYFDVTGSF